MAKVLYENRKNGDILSKADDFSDELTAEKYIEWDVASTKKRLDAAGVVYSVSEACDENGHPYIELRRGNDSVRWTRLSIWRAD